MPRASLSITSFAVLACLILSSVSATWASVIPRDDSSVHQLEKRFSNARMTFYDAGLGACGHVNTNADFIVALNAPQWEGGRHCGETVTISYEGKTAQATIMDLCPGCPYGGLDLTRGLFGFFANHDKGVIQASWDFGGSAPAPPPPPAPPRPTTTTTPRPSPTPTPAPPPPPPPPTTTRTTPTPSPPPPPPPARPTTTSVAAPPPPPPSPSPPPSSSSRAPVREPSATTSASRVVAVAPTPTATPNPDAAAANKVVADIQEAFKALGALLVKIIDMAARENAARHQ
ncbi:B2-aldehyde-forming enzyme [Coprinopsis sp. MPI-PUGE-AT-0042]|nr:B2-aldehyde-forming enzyme [Coprinopsis sp. MPI-PUGE-AT-0042]